MQMLGDQCRATFAQVIDLLDWCQTLQDKAVLKVVVICGGCPDLLPIGQGCSRSEWLTSRNINSPMVRIETQTNRDVMSTEHSPTPAS